jgi:uncharacterized membrane protein YdbT with pleckstrin-like domain
VAKKIKKMELPKDEPMWKDRKRFFGLPISFTRYTVFEDRLILKVGLLHTITDETLLYRIMDIRLSRKLSQKIFGVGTVILITADKSHPTLELKNVKHSDRVRRLLSQQVDSQRVKRGLTSREFLGGLDIEC